MKLRERQTQLNTSFKIKSYQIYLGLFGVALACRIVVAFLLHQPGYIDAYYYYQVAANFHTGHGLSETSLWNYQLDSFVPNHNLNHPAFNYWLPLSTWLTIASFSIFGVSFGAAQLPFVLLAACLPPLAFWLGKLTFGLEQSRYSWTMALVMLFPGRYFLFLNAPDNFAPFAVIILLGLISIYKGLWSNQRYLWVAGLLGGLAYLSRSDGVLLVITLVVGFGYRRWQLRREPQTKGPGWLVLAGALALALAVVTPWLWRNLITFGAIVPATSSKILFLRDYNELFSYNLPLDFNYYVNQTLPALISTKFTALWLDLLIITVEGLFLLGPFSLVGLLLLKGRVSKNSYVPFGLYASLLYLTMVLIFTLAGEHGTIFHSAGGLLPFQAGAFVVCIDALANLYRRYRKKLKVAQFRNLVLGLLLFANVVLTLYVAYTNVKTWDDDYTYAIQVGQWFKQNNLDSNAIIVGEPLSYSYATSQSAIPLASDGVQANLEAARKYGATYLALGKVHYNSLNQLYEQKYAAGLKWITTLPNGTQIYQVS